MEVHFGKPVGNFVKWLVQNYSFFDGIKNAILWFYYRLRYFYGFPARSC